MLFIFYILHRLKNENRPGHCVPFGAPHYEDGIHTLGSSERNKDNYGAFKDDLGGRVFKLYTLLS